MTGSLEVDERLRPGLADSGEKGDWAGEITAQVASVVYMFIDVMFVRV
jgi:hypothetical protein